MQCDWIQSIKLEHIYIKNLNYSTYKKINFSIKIRKHTNNSYWGYLNEAGFNLVFNLN